MQKMVLIIVLLILQSSLLVAQQTKEEKLEQLKQRDGVKVTEVEKNILKIEYPNGKTILKNVSNYEPRTTNKINYSPTFDSTIIDLTTIDTTLYYQKYNFWQEVPLGQGPNNFLLVGDVNNNNLPELYGQMKDYTSDYSDIVIFEKNLQDGFDSVYSYDSTSIALSIYDIDKGGMDELHLRRFNGTGPYSGNNYLFFKKPVFDTFATILSFVFYYPFEPYITQQNDNKFGDWDGDKFTDQIFHIGGSGIFIFEYNPLITNFDSVYFYDYTSINQEFAGFTIGDFDQDGKAEFFSGSTHGDVLSIENTGNNTYAPSWTGMVETFNAYQLAQTNDIDRNGKKEIWVGGDAFYPGIGSITRITLFEADGNNSYQVVGRIDLVGVFSFFAQNYQSVDVDKDGVEEMMVCIEQTVLILKFNGSPDHQTYELFYFKQNDFENNNILYFGANMYDLTGDGKDELLINAADDPPGLGTIKWFNYIYKANFPVSVDDENHTIPNEYSLYQNYPNPFNPSTTIKYSIPESGKVTITVYDVLGREVTILVNEFKSEGSYEIIFNSEGLSSGVYIYRITAANNGRILYTDSKQMLLLK